MTESQREMLALLTPEPQRCAGLGERLWHHGRGNQASGTSTCPWARPAGKVLRHLEKLGYAKQKQIYADGGALGWVITNAGRRALEAA